MRKVVRALALTFALLVVASALGGCTTYRDELVRSQQVFEQSQYERSLGLLRALEPDVFRLARPEQAEYAYLRGMTDYRLGFRPDARHWLALARMYEDTSPGILPTDWKGRMNEALDEMNGVVYAEGVAALATSPKPSEDPVPAPPAASTSPAATPGK